MERPVFPPSKWSSRLTTLFVDILLIASLAMIAFYDGPNDSKAALSIQLLLWPIIIFSTITAGMYAFLDKSVLIDIMKIRAVRDLLEAKNDPQLVRRFQQETEFLEHTVIWKLWPDKLVKSRAKSLADMRYSTASDVVILSLLLFCGFHWLALLYGISAIAVMKLTAQARVLYLYRYGIPENTDIEVKYEH